MEYKFTTGNFNDEVMNSEIPVLVDFYADWCMPCKMMSPLVEEMAGKYAGKVKVGKINVDEQQSLAAQFNVMSIPTFLIMKDGKVVNKTVGAMPKDALDGMLQQLV